MCLNNCNFIFLVITRLYFRVIKVVVSRLYRIWIGPSGPSSFDSLGQRRLLASNNLWPSGLWFETDLVRRKEVRFRPERAQMALKLVHPRPNLRSLDLGRSLGRRLLPLKGRLKAAKVLKKAGQKRMTFVVKVMRSCVSNQQRLRYNKIGFVLKGWEREKVISCARNLCGSVAWRGNLKVLSALSLVYKFEEGIEPEGSIRKGWFWTEKFDGCVN